MKTNRSYILLSSALGLALLSASAHAAVLSIDFGTGTSPVEPGFTAQTTGTATTYSTSFGDISVASTGNFFNRSAGGTYTSAALYGDFNFINSTTSAMTITLAGPGIAANTAYDLRFYSYDSQHGSGGGTVTYTGVSGTGGSTSINYSNAFVNDNASTATFTANGSGEIVIDVTGTNEGPRVNGLEVIPEPSVALLGGIGLLALLRRRR